MAVVAAHHVKRRGAADRARRRHEHPSETHGPGSSAEVDPYHSAHTTWRRRPAPGRLRHRHRGQHQQRPACHGRGHASGNPSTTPRHLICPFTSAHGWRLSPPRANGIGTARITQMRRPKPRSAEVRRSGSARTRPRLPDGGKAQGRPSPSGRQGRGEDRTLRREAARSGVNGLIGGRRISKAYSALVLSATRASGIATASASEVGPITATTRSRPLEAGS